MVDKEYKMIGKVVKEVRRKKNITQEQLADRTELSISHIRNIESGNTKIGLDAVIKIANELDTSVDIILQGSLKNKRKVLDYVLVSKFADYDDRTVKALIEMAEVVKANMNK